MQVTERGGRKEAKGGWQIHVNVIVGTHRHMHANTYAHRYDLSPPNQKRDNKASILIASGSFLISEKAFAAWHLSFPIDPAK